jgi:hypothetical protein
MSYVKVVHAENQKNSPHSPTPSTEQITLPPPLNPSKECGNKKIWQDKQTRYEKFK